MKIRNDNGFTLFELVLVIALIAILFGIFTIGTHRLLDSFEQKAEIRNCEKIFALMSIEIELNGIINHNDKISNVLADEHIPISTFDGDYYYEYDIHQNGGTLTVFIGSDKNTMLDIFPDELGNQYIMHKSIGIKKK